MLSVEMPKPKRKPWHELLRQAQAFEDSGQAGKAEAVYRELIAANADFHPAYHALGLLAYRTGNLPAAAELIKAAAAIDRVNPIYWRDYGEICRCLGWLTEAVAAALQACRLAPADVDAFYNLGLAYNDGKDYEAACRAYREALKLQPNHGLTWNNLGAALEKLGKQAEALQAYDQAVVLNPGHAEAQNNLGAIHSELGNVEQAIACFNAALAVRQDFIEAHYNLSLLKTYGPGDPQLAVLETLFAHRGGMADPARIRLCFALGKALDDIKEYDRAFAAYAEGNRLQHALLPLDESQADRLLQRIMQVFDRDFFEKRRDWRGSKAAPIFIVGMPRSGTTLLEQILCSHSAVFGGGELIDLHDTIADLTAAGPNKAFTESMAAFTEADFQRLGDEYAGRVWQRARDKLYITDKMPANFMYLGLIHLALPNAKIIHAMREPMDSCFSCYTRLFQDSMAFAYDQETLGRYYNRYSELMRHWHRVLPQNRILDVSYEELVANPEAQSRRLLEFAGLPWQADCLNFHRNRRPVKTASMLQVRQPVYTSSIGRWQHFAQYLAPLRQIVGNPGSNHAAAAFEQQQPTAAELSERCLAMQARDEHNAVLQLLEPYLPSNGAGPLLWHLQGISLYRLGRFMEARQSYEQALAMQPDFPEALNSLGYLLQDLGEPVQALEAFAQAVRLAPQFAMARLNLGMAQLKLGDWQAGWENYEARWTGSAESGKGGYLRPVCPLPQWRGETVGEQQALLVISEQGFGDVFQFSRYLPLAAKRFRKVGFVCSEPVLRLLEWSFADRIVLLRQLPADYSAWDWQCPLMSLPLAFATTAGSIPANGAYLNVPRAAAAHWLERLNTAAPGRFRVGVAWAGRPAHLFDAQRSLVFEQLLPLLDDARIAWVSLQKWGADSDQPAIPAQAAWLDWTGEMHDFADTAALAQNLDLIISIDSSMVHLAGALMRPVWMLNRYNSDWRWGHRRQFSLWYPALRIFNQPRYGDWDSVMGELKAALQALPMPPNTSKQPGRQRVGQTPPQLLAAEPQALHQSALLAYQAGKMELAAELIEKAIAIAPNTAQFHCNLAEIRRRQGLLDEAIKHGRLAVEIDPGNASAHSNLGIAWYDAGDYGQAEACHLRALALQPDSPPSLNNLGSIARAVKNLPLAAEWYAKALAAQPDHLEALNNLGTVLIEDERPDQGAPFLEKALQIQPSYPEALCNLGLARFMQDRLSEALPLLEASLRLKPAYSEALASLGRVMHKLERYPEAEALLRDALASADRAEIWSLLATLHLEQGEEQKAESAYQKALEIDPALPDALTGLANLRSEQGRFDQAEALLNQAIAINSRHLEARFHLVQIKKIKPDDPNLAALAAKLPEIDELPADKRICLHYALGKAYDDLQQYEQGFSHFLAGARLKRGKLQYSAEEEQTFIQSIIETCSRTFLESLSGVGDHSTQPVFILGMPRSGTTLTEQIIASHPAVHGAGELGDLLQLAQQPAAGPSSQAYPLNLPGLSRDDFFRWGSEYAARLRCRAPQALRITDKMPANYLILGLIPLLLPKAKIIHVKRNPVDTCLSCFTRLFNRQQYATYDLREMGLHYANYRRLMRHWRQVLPETAFIEVEYEQLVADPSGQARRLIEYCELEWDESCLAFYRNKRSIRTASVIQVRQPIYATSVERWRHYQAYLRPLLEALGEFAQ